MFPKVGTHVFVYNVFAGSLVELPSTDFDFSLSMLFDLALVFAEYSDPLSFLKKGVPFE
jgi:hypothetical protein